LRKHPQGVFFVQRKELIMNPVLVLQNLFKEITNADLDVSVIGARYNSRLSEDENLRALLITEDTGDYVGIRSTLTIFDQDKAKREENFMVLHAICWKDQCRENIYGICSVRELYYSERKEFTKVSHCLQIAARFLETATILTDPPIKRDDQTKPKKEEQKCQTGTSVGFTTE
jgi:hypothetical protein